ncbi:MAG: tandem-95 repeat protein [Candidatus Omnitrophica bacterium]|nr:tandem-95 repeat protein [Candidatus Omnitrophota bacterium]
MKINKILFAGLIFFLVPNLAQATEAIVSDASGLPGQNGVSVSISVQNNTVPSVFAIDLWLTYDANKLQVVSAEAGTITSGAQFFSNIATPGIIKIAVYQTDVFPAQDGVLANVRFNVKSTAVKNTTCALQLTKAVFNDTNVTPQNGTFTILAPANQPPVFNTLPNPSVNENSFLTFNVSATDPDGDKVTYSVSGTPLGATFDTSSGLFSWTPNYNQGGQTYDVVFTATDGTDSVTKTVSITVVNVNRPPTLNNIGSQSGSEGTAMKFTISGSDLDQQDTLTYSASGALQSYFNPSTRTFDWTPNYTQAGDYTMTFTVSDGTVTASEVVPIHIANVNQTPLLSAITPQTAQEGAKFTYALQASDPDGDTLTYSLSGFPAGSDAAVDLSTKILSWTPLAGQAGVYPVTVTVKDPSNASAAQTFNITVSHTNRAPTLSAIPDQSASEGIKLSYTLQASDPDNDVLTYTLTGFPGGSDAAVDPSTKKLTWTPAAGQAGIYNITVTVKDPGNLSVSQSFKITVSHTNNAPILSPIASITKDDGIAFTINLSASDIDNDALTFSIAGLPNGNNATIDPVTQIFSWTPPIVAQDTSYNVTVTVKDPGNLSASQTFTITIKHKNHAPTLNHIGSQGINEGDTKSFTISGSDMDTQDTLIYSVSPLPLPNHASFNAATKTFSWSPDYTQAGNYSFTFSVFDGTLSASETVAITVNNVNQPPVLNHINDQSVLENSAITPIVVTGSDPDGDALTYSASGVPDGTPLPVGAVFNTSTHTLTWTPNYNQGSPEPYYIKFSVTDGSLTTSQTMAITVGNYNRPPAFNVIPSKSVNEGDTLSLMVSASDPDGNDLTYSASDLPDGATFNAATRTLTWTPNFNQGRDAPYIVKFTVSDSALTDVETAAITVIDVNRPPSLSAIDPQSVNEGSAFTYTLQATDPDGDALTYSLTGLPVDAQIDPISKKLSWTPPQGLFVGKTVNHLDYPVTVTVTDSGKIPLSDSKTFTLTVHHVNRSPTLSAIADQTTNEGVKLSFPLQVTDPDGDALTYTISGLPAGSDAAVDPVTKMFSWMPAVGQSQITNIYNVTVTATDPENMSDAKTFKITVNRAPTFNVIGNQTINEGTKLTVTLPVADPDSNTLTYAIAGLPAGSDAAVDPATKKFSWTPGVGQSQTTNIYNVTVTAIDPGGLSAAQTFKITVNRAPTFNSIGSQTFTENVEKSFTVLATDKDTQDTLTYTVAGLPPGATFDPATRIFTWKPSYTQGRTDPYMVTFTVSDEKLTASETVAVTVTDVPQRPVLTFIGNKTVEAKQTLSITAYATDPDDATGLSLVFSASNLPTGAAFDQNSKTFSWTPTLDQVGSAVVSFTVNKGALSDVENVHITVTQPAPPPNQAPKWVDIRDWTIQETETLHFTVSAQDPENDPLTYTMDRTIVNASFNPDTRTFDWTPNYGQAGTYPVTFTVTDGHTPVTHQITITVIKKNQPPVIGTITDRTVEERSSITVSIPAADPDSYPNSLSFTSTNLPQGASLNASAGMLTWTPTEGQAGIYPITVTASDGKDAVSGSFKITVTKFNHPPVFDPVVVPAVNPQQPVNFTISATDQDNDPLTYYLVSTLPKNATFDLDTRQFNWTPDYAQYGTWPVTFQVSDGTNTVQKIINITVNKVNQPPVLDAVVDQTAYEGSEFTLILSASDPDGDPLTYSVAGLTSNAKIDAAAKKLTWTPAWGETGDHTVTVSVSDGKLSSTQTFKITVMHVNRPPEFAALSDQTTDAEKEFSLTIAATDPDGDAVTYSVAPNLPNGAVFDPLTQKFTWTPANNQGNITWPVKFQVSDGSLNVQKVINITVNKVNHAPTLDPVLDQTANEGSALTVPLSASDPDGDALTFSVSGLNGDAAINSETKVLSWTPAWGQAGDHTVTVSVSDGKIAAAKTFKITVNHVNRPPALNTIGTKTAYVSNMLTFTVSGYDLDLGDTVSYSVTGLPPGAVWNQDTHTFSWVPAYNQAGKYPVTFKITDQNDASSQEIVSLIISDANLHPIIPPIELQTANHPPEFNPLGDQTVFENQQLTFQVAATDADQDPLAYSALNLPFGANFDKSNQTFSWRPYTGQNGSYLVTFVVSDGKTKVQSPIMIKVQSGTISLGLSNVSSATSSGNMVTPVNVVNVVTSINSKMPVNTDMPVKAKTKLPPFFGSLANQWIREGQTLRISVYAISADADSPLTYSATGLPTGATFNAGTRIFEWTPNYDQGGVNKIYTIKFTVSDGTNSVSREMNVAVADVDRPPTIDPIPDQTATVGSVLSFMIHAVDLDHDPVKISVYGVPAGDTHSMNNNRFTWTPARPGNYQLTVYAADPSGERNKTNVRVSVSPREAVAGR